MIISIFLLQNIVEINAITYNEDPMLTQAYVLMEAETGRVLKEQNGYTEVPIGTMCKLMTVLLVAEAIESGELKLDEMVVTSSHANSMQGAQIWLMHGEQMSVRDLLKGVIIGNANDATVALAEAVGQSEENFTAMMNTRAFELGMRNTGFYNSSGYGTEEQYSTAYDMALLCRELAKHGFLYEYMTCWRDFVRGEETELVNENKLVKNYDGIIGFKAGHSTKAGNCIAIGAERNNTTYIVVALGYSDKDERFDVAKSLLATGFSNYQVTNPSFSNEHLMPIKVVRGIDSAVMIEAKELNSLVVSKGKTEDITSVIFVPEYITAPVKKGQAIGVIGFYIDDVLLYETDLITTNAVDEMTLFKAFKKICTNLLK
jgi:D-alanyl-D-alanine carboxypeptidase (penicillin-binding protein 5/6)